MVLAGTGKFHVISISGTLLARWPITVANINKSNFKKVINQILMSRNGFHAMGSPPPPHALDLTLRFSGSDLQAPPQPSSFQISLPTRIPVIGAVRANACDV